MLKIHRRYHQLSDHRQLISTLLAQSNLDRRRRNGDFGANTRTHSKTHSHTHLRRFDASRRHDDDDTSEIQQSEDTV